MEIALIHVVPTADPTTLSPIRRVLVQLWMLALKNRATKVWMSYESGLSKLSYLVADRWEELVPLPDTIAPIVGQEVRAWLNPSRFRRALADQLRRAASQLDPDFMSTIHYPFLLVIDPIWSLWGVTIQQRPEKGSVSFELLECTDWAYDQIPLIRSSMPAMDQITEAEFAKWSTDFGLRE